MLRTEVLKRYGVADNPKLAIRPTKPDMWRVGINETAVDVGGALKLSAELESIGEVALAWHIVETANLARRNQVQGL